MRSVLGLRKREAAIGGVRGRCRVFAVLGLGLRVRLFGFGWRHGHKRSLFDGYLMAEHRVLRIAAVRRLF